MRLLIIIAAAFVLDAVFGDPHWLPHPICLIGRGISFFEKCMRRLFKNELIGGFFLVAIMLILSFGLPFTLLYLAGIIHPYLSFALELLFCYQIFAAKSLKTESMKVYKPLTEGNLPEARKYLSYIVGRDTKGLEADGIIKATVETVAENTTDGVIAPLIFMAIGGAPLAFLYKAINTMDSMVGYKNEKYLYFGRCAARLDDIANFIPARLTALLMILSAFFLRLDGRAAAAIYMRDRRNHKSPNSAQTESVCAGALGVQLAGNASYFGKLIEKPTIGDALRPVAPKDIILANRLMYLSSVLGLLLALAIRALFV